MNRGRSGRMTRGSADRRRARVLRVTLAGLLILQGFAAAGQTVGGTADRPVIREPVGSALYQVQFMPGMPGMPGMQGMGPMMTPQQGGTQGSMGGGMAMVMTGDSIAEMMGGACAAGVFIGGVAAVAAMTPAAPLALSGVLSSAGIGCGFAMAATAAGMAGMLGARELTKLAQ